MLSFMSVVQFLSAAVLIVCILLQTTKSESGSSGGMGWGVIGGKSSASFRTHWGLEAHLNRITTYTAVSFMATSLLTAILRFRA